MKVLLIYPQYSHSNEHDSRAPSMALFYLAAMLEKGGHEVTIYDASLGPITRKGQIFHYGVSQDEVEVFLKKNHYDVVGITCSFTARWKYVAKIAQQVKAIAPHVPVAVGGLFPTSEWEYCLNQCAAVDIILLGEAELSFSKIVDQLSHGSSVVQSCEGVDGVCFRLNEKLIIHPKNEYNEQLDDLPFPAWHLVDLKEYFKYQRRIFELRTPCLPILSSRSCPNRCTFCNMYITHGRGWRPRSAENVLNEIEYLTKRFDIRRFYFIDDNFSLDLKRAKAICQGLIDRKLHVEYNFHNGLSIKSMDFELVDLMKRSGCTSVCLAIESGSERIRNQVYRKGLSTEKIKEVFGYCRKAGIPMIGYFLVGAPGETRVDFEMSKKLLAELPLTLVTVAVLTPYPQTEIYDECQKKGWLIESSLLSEDRVEMFSSLIKTPDFTPEDVARWQQELYLSFIYYHWPTLLKEMLRPGGVVNKDMIGKFLGMLKSRLFRRCTSPQKD